MPDGQVDVHMYVNAGTAADPAHIVAIRLLDYHGKVMESWDGEQLAAINTNAITNDFDYQKVVPGKVFGLTGGVGAGAMVHLPVSSSGFISTSSGPYQLQMLSINGHEWEVAAHTAAH